MASIERDGYCIAYEVHGSGRPVLLLHGVTVSFVGNYAAWGWIQRLNAAGCQVIGMDFRGHGRSDKPHDPAAYGSEKLAGDALALLDHLGHERVSVVGYSMGSIIALDLLRRAPERFGPSVLMATGDGLVGHPPYTVHEVGSQLQRALMREAFPADLPPHVAAYWNFAEKVGGDRLAALAAIRADYPPCPPEAAAAIEVPVLVVSGEADPVLGRGPRLAQCLGAGRYVEIPGAGHFELCQLDSALAEVVSFLSA
jgi:pimeloyl-ACP methyl ester carboxylesterase